MADINLQIAEALSRGLGPQDILKGLSESDNPEHRAWVANYKTNLISDNQPSANTTSSPKAPDVSGLQALGGVANQAANWYANLSTPEQIAYPIGTILGTYAGKKIIEGTGNLVFNSLRDRQEIRKQAALNALAPSPAVQVQQQQLALQQAEQANRFAQQAASANVGPVEDPLLNARVQTETQRLASETARTKAAEAQAQLIQEKIIAQQRRAAMVKANPAGAAAQVAAAEGLPAEAQPSVTAKPTVADLQQKLGIATETGKSTPLETTVFSPENIPPAQAAPEASAAPPANVEPAPVSPKTATPTTPSTSAEVVTNPNATPVEKTVDLVENTSAATEAPKVAGAVEPQVLQTGTKKPAYVGQGPTTGKFKSSYPDVASVPKDYAFVPGAQSINTPRNNIGQETFTEHYTGKPYPANYEEALRQGNEINRSLGRMTREEMKAKGIEPPNVVSGIGARVGSDIETGAGAKNGARLINAGLNGVKTAGMLVALSDLAKANNLSEAGGKLGEAAINSIPGVGPAAMLYTGNAGAPTLTEENLPQTVRANLEVMRQNLSPQEYAKMRDKYLQNVALNGIAPTDREKLLSNLQSGFREKTQPNTLLPVRPPR